MKKHLRDYLIEKIASMLSERRAVPNIVIARELEAGVKEDLCEVLDELERDNIICHGTTLNEDYVCLSEYVIKRC